jgi:hypothetical protein
MGIIKEKNIWATNINHLNDFKEFREFVNPFLDMFRVKSVQPILKGIFEKHSRMIYVCSFSQKDDDLSQWRAYSPNANGFSIGFNYSKLKSMAPSGFELKAVFPTEELFGLHRCKYDPKGAEVEMVGIIDRNMKSNSPDIPDVPKMMAEITTLAPCYKNEKFKDEEEWRLIKLVYNEEIKFREGKTLVIPYIEIDLKDKDGNLPIESICIGPTPYMAESEASLEMLLKEKKVSNVKIIKSKVPYRAL